MASSDTFKIPVGRRGAGEGGRGASLSHGAGEPQAERGQRAGEGIVRVRAGSESGPVRGTRTRRAGLGRARVRAGSPAGRPGDSDSAHCMRLVTLPVRASATVTG